MRPDPRFQAAPTVRHLGGPSRRLLVGLVVATVLFVAPAAHGDTITQVQSVPLTPTDWATAVTFNQFNPAQGTLNSITLLIDGAIESELFATNTGATTDTATVTATATITLTRPDLSTLVVAPSVSHTETLNPGDSFDVTASNSASNSVTSPPPVSDLAAYTGVGLISLPIDAVGSSNVSSSSGNVDGGALTSAGADVTLTYNFTPFATVVPEPSTLALFTVAIGIGALTLCRRRRA